MVLDVMCDVTTIPPQGSFSVEEAVFEEHTYRGIRIPELSLKAISAGGGPPKGSPLITESNQYNELIRWAFETEGFVDFFLAHNNVVSYQLVAERFGKAFADRLFTLSFPLGTPQFVVFDNWLFDTNCKFNISFSVEGQEYSFLLPDDMDEYGCYGICDDKSFFYDWSDTGLFFSLGLYKRFKADNILCRKALLLDEDDAMWFAINWGSWNLAIESSCKIMRTLIDLGYMREYSLVTKDKYPAFSLWSDRPDKSFGFAVLDQKYKKDKLLVEKINCLLSEVADEKETYDRDADDEYEKGKVDYSDYIPSPKSSGALNYNDGEPILDTPCIIE